MLVLYSHESRSRRPFRNHQALCEIFAAPIVDLTGLHLSEVGIAREVIGTDDDAAGGACVTP
jgi:hypothetical protein